MDLHALNQQQAAALLSVTTRTLRDWEKAGEGMPRNGDGSYNGPALVAWYVSRCAGEELDANRERARKDKEHADKLALQNAVTRGELLTVESVRRAWSDCIASARAKLMSMPAKLGPQLVNLADANIVSARIRAEVYAAVTELADSEPGDERGGDGAAAVGRPVVAAAARVDGERVGGFEAEA